MVKNIQILVIVFCITLFFAGKSKEPNHVSTLSLETYRASIVNDLNEIAEEVLGNKQISDANVMELTVNALRNKYNNSEAIDAFYAVLEESESDYSEVCLNQEFTNEEQLIIAEINKDLELFDNAVMIKDYFANKFDEISSSTQLSLPVKEEMLKHLTLMDVSVDFMASSADNRALNWCVILGGFNIPKGQDCPFGFVLASYPSDPPGYMCCLPLIKMTSTLQALSNGNNRGVLDVPEAVGAIYAALLKTIEQ